MFRIEFCEPYRTFPYSREPVSFILHSLLHLTLSTFSVRDAKNLNRRRGALILLILSTFICFQRSIIQLCEQEKASNKKEHFRIRKVQISSFSMEFFLYNNESPAIPYAYAYNRLIGGSIFVRFSTNLSYSLFSFSN